MILDEIQKYYFRHNYQNEVGMILEISKDTFHKMQKEDKRMIKMGNPDENGELKPMLNSQVFVVDTDDSKWSWKKDFK